MFFVLFEPWNPGVEMCAKYIMLIHIPPGTEKMCAKYIFIPLPAVFRGHIALPIAALSVHTP